jgi:hypothetical protein
LILPPRRPARKRPFDRRERLPAQQEWRNQGQNNKPTRQCQRREEKKVGAIVNGRGSLVGQIGI